MGRLTLLLVLSIAAAVNPRVRDRLAPHAERALAPVHEWSARYRAGEISRALQADAARGLPLPSERGLESFLARRYPGSLPTLDPWGTPFFLRRDRWEARVGSAGRDRVPGTRDDILSAPFSLRLR